MSIDQRSAPDVPMPRDSVLEPQLRSFLREHRTERRLARRRCELMGFRRDRMHRERGRLPFEIRRSFPGVTIVLLPSAAERIVALDQGVVDADWIVELTDITAATAAVRPVSMPQLIRQLGRLTAWAQATQTDWLARFARPGVAVPIGDVLEAAMASDSDTSIPASHSVQPNDEDLYAIRSYAQTSVYGDPVWDIVVTEHAARFASAEIGATLRLSPVTARGQVEDAVELVDQLPETLAAWRNGRLDRSRVRVIADRTAVLDRESRRMVEDTLLGSGSKDPAELTPSRLRREVDRAVIACDPKAARRRAEKARQNRKVQVTPLGDDMARFSAEVSAPTAALATEVLDVAAKNIPKSARAGRTLDQLRADVFADIVDGLARYGFVDLRGSDRCPTTDAGCPTEHRTAADGERGPSTDIGNPSNVPPAAGNNSNSPPAGSEYNNIPPAADDNVSAPAQPWKPLGSSVSVTIAASTLAGVDDDPAQLAGYGWITADLARALATSARSARALISRDTEAHPPDPGRQNGEHSNCGDGDAANNRWCSTEIDYGRSVYRPPAALRDLVIQRDRTCRHPGCRASAHRCDIDHRKPFRQSASDPTGGVTCPCNLDSLCRFHHRLKTFTGWSAIRLPGNRMQWTSPLGATFVDEPEPLPMGTAFDAPPF